VTTNEVVGRHDEMAQGKRARGWIEAEIELPQGLSAEPGPVRRPVCPTR
jgi:hypothetical protein